MAESPTPQRCTKTRLALQTSSFTRATHLEHKTKCRQTSASHHNSSIHTPGEGAEDGSSAKTLRCLCGGPRSVCSCASPTVLRGRTFFMGTTFCKPRFSIPVHHKRLVEMLEQTWLLIARKLGRHKFVRVCWESHCASERAA
jgi:hypothetical protein